MDIALAVQQLKAQQLALDQFAIVAETDSRGTITYVNDKFCEVSKYSHEELIGANHRIVNSGHHPKSFFTNMYATISSGNVWRGEIKNRAKDGSYYWVDTAIVPFMNEEGRAEKYLAIRAVITDRVQAEEALRASRSELVSQIEQLARSNKELEQFAYVASHDLQEPLRTVSGYLQLLQGRHQDALDEDANEFISYAVKAAARMKQLIEDLLAFSRVGTTAKEPAPTACDVVITEVLDSLELAIDDANAMVTHDPLPVVSADAGQLMQLLQNLISNALKYRHADRDPVIHISAEQREGEWVFSVKDNGIGIEDKYAERIFVIFQRLHGKEEYSGTGIGLAVCKKIVERHGGRIWVESVPGEGSTFLFTIPLYEEYANVG